MSSRSPAFIRSLDYADFMPKLEPKAVWNLSFPSLKRLLQEFYDPLNCLMTSRISFINRELPCPRPISWANSQYPDCPGPEEVLHQILPIYAWRRTAIAAVSIQP